MNYCEALPGLIQMFTSSPEKLFQETKDDIESDISENDNLPYSPLIYPTTKSTSSRGAPPMLERSNTSPHVHRPGLRTFCF